MARSRNSKTQRGVNNGDSRNLQPNAGRRGGSRQRRLDHGSPDLAKSIAELEDHLVAHESVDVFDEMYNLLAAKLYDEMTSTKGRNEGRFHTRQDDSVETIHLRIQELLQDAHRDWGFLNGRDPAIHMSKSSLATAVARLEQYTLNSMSWDALGTAVEVLASPHFKGELGQYFTPRHICIMCVRMLNPQPGEVVLDPACGSGTFLTSTLEHLSDTQSSRDGLKDRRTSVKGADHVVGMDYDRRMVDIAQMNMLLWGCNRYQISRGDFLDLSTWDQKGPGGQTQADVIVTNPPFAGRITDSRILKQYELGHSETNAQMLASHRSRTVLFVEACLNRLRDGGRMAIVLPAGLMNNSSERYVRDLMLRKARLLASVSLDATAFRPFTATPTTIVLLQKVSKEMSTKDYRSFFAISARSGKDRSGRMVTTTVEGIEVDTDVLEIARAFREFVEEDGGGF